MIPILNDMRMALRRLIRQRLFTVIAILTLAIGIGANSAIFTLVNGVLLRPLPFHNASQLVWIHGIDADAGNDVLSAPVFLAIRQHNRSFTDVAMYTGTTATVTGLGDAQQIAGGAVSASFFSVIGVKPLLGSVLPADADETGHNNVVVLSEGMWREKFGGDHDVIGKSIIMDGTPRTIVGVMPASLSYPTDWKFWAPVEYTTSIRNPRNVFALSWIVIGRMKAGVTRTQADADVAAIEDQAEVAGDAVNPKWSAGTSPLHELATGDVRMPLLILLSAVGLVLLIACANLANLLLAQAATRATDFAVRRALGASPWRLVRQLLAESLTLALVGGAGGLLFGAWAADALVTLLPPDMPRVPDLHVDWMVVAFTAGISIAAAMLFGLAPALQARQGALSDVLREGGRGLASRGSLRTRAMLVVGETALAFSLVIGAGLLIRSLSALTHVDPGFRTDHTTSFELSLPKTRYDEDAKVSAFYDQLLARIAAIPNVAASGAVMNLPLGGSDTQITFDVEGRPELPPEKKPVLEVHIATPAYFKTLGIPLRSGRLLDAHDRADATRVALLSEDAAKKFFPGEDPIGKRIKMGWMRNGTLVEGTVVGVVGGTRQNKLRDAAAPMIYFPEAQLPNRDMSIAVRTTGSSTGLSATLRDEVHSLDPNLALADIRSMDEIMHASVASDRFMTELLGIFSAMALVLAAVGIFGVISYGVTQRRREFGVRMAVGASRSEIVRLVLQGAMRLATAGLLIGAVAAYAMSRVLGALLFGVKAGDPTTYVLGALALMAVALGAAALPAWTASRLPPSAVLNTD